MGMKIFVLVLTLIAVNHCDGVIQRIHEHVNNVTKSCAGFEAILNQSMDTFLKNNKKYRNSMTMCEQIHTYLLTSFEPAIQKWDKCVKNSHKGTFTTAIKSLISGIQHLCNMRGESIFELANPCLTLDSPEKKQIVDCDKQTETQWKTYAKTITARNFCNVLTSAKSCTEKRANSFCKNPKTRYAAMSSFDALLTPCSAASSIRNLFFNVLSSAENNN